MSVREDFNCLGPPAPLILFVVLDEANFSHLSDQKLPFLHILEFIFAHNVSNFDFDSVVLHFPRHNFLVSKVISKPLYKH